MTYKERQKGRKTWRRVDWQKARGSDPIQASQALTAFLTTQPLVWFPNPLAAFPSQMGTLSTQTPTLPLLEKSIPIRSVHLSKA